MSDIKIKMNPKVEKRIRLVGSESLMPITGYPGPAEGNDKVRVYQDLGLTSYIEIKVEDIVDVNETVSDDEPDIFYVKADAKVNFVNKTQAVASIGLVNKLKPSETLPIERSRPMQLCWWETVVYKDPISGKRIEYPIRQCVDWPVGNFGNNQDENVG